MVANMERFYEPNMITCLKSGSLLFTAALVPTAIAYLADWLLLTGVAVIGTGALLISHNLACAGFNAMLVHLNQHSQLKALSCTFVAIVLNAVAFLALTIAGVNLESDVNLVRLIALFAAIAFLPLTVLIVIRVSDILI